MDGDKIEESSEQKLISLLVSSEEGAEFREIIKLRYQKIDLQEISSQSIKNLKLIDSNVLNFFDQTSAPTNDLEIKIRDLMLDLEQTFEYMITNYLKDIDIKFYHPVLRTNSFKLLLTEIVLRILNIEIKEEDTLFFITSLKKEIADLPFIQTIKRVTSGILEYQEITEGDNFYFREYDLDTNKFTELFKMSVTRVSEGYLEVTACYPEKTLVKIVSQHQILCAKDIYNICSLESIKRLDEAPLPKFEQYYLLTHKIKLL